MTIEENNFDFDNNCKSLEINSSLDTKCNMKIEENNFYSSIGIFYNVNVFKLIICNNVYFFI